MIYSEYSLENINIEDSTIMVEDKWYNVKDLKTVIKKKIDSDDFDIIPMATAIQDLSEAMKNITDIKFKLHSDVIKSYQELAKSNDTTFENLLREALINRIDYGLTSNMTPVPGASAGGGAKAKGAKVKKVACRKCKAVIVVDSPKRPITVVCPECGTKGKLSK